MSKVKKWAFLFDVHVPQHHKPSVKAALDFLKDYKPDALGIGHDFINLEAISHWTKNNPGKRENQRLIKEVDAANEILDEIDKIKSIKEKTYQISNHEIWLEYYLNDHPELKGIFDLDSLLKLTERGYKTLKFNDPLKVGDFKIWHGWKSTKYHGNAHLEKINHNCITAHNHTRQLFCRPTHDGVITSISAPCLCRYDMDYKKNLPSNWLRGVVIIEEYQCKSWVYIMPIRSGKLIWEGKVYG